MKAPGVQYVRVFGDLVEWFLAGVGVVLCLLSPLLFNILLAVVMALALEDNNSGAHISRICIPDLRFADDICLIAESDDDLQQLVDKVHTTSSRFGLEISAAKTEVQCIGRQRQ